MLCFLHTGEAPDFDDESDLKWDSGDARDEVDQSGDQVMKIISAIDALSEAEKKKLRAKKDHECPVCRKTLRSGLSGLKKHMKVRVCAL